VSALAPLGIRYDTLVTKLECDHFVTQLKHKKRFVVGYVGGFTTGGYSKGVEDLIFLAQYAQINQLPISIVLIGATKSEKLHFDALARDLGVQKCYLNIKSRVPHSKALKLMKSFDVLILPAPKSSTYDGVPLKLLEYLAAGRITLIAETKLNRKILPSNLHNYFYSTSDYSNIWPLIQSAIKSRDLSQRIFKSVDYASKFTWDIRTENILKTIHKS
jgi:glycosyltransferase involved in cell wall biosynthesis